MLLDRDSGESFGEVVARGRRPKSGVILASGIGVAIQTPVHEGLPTVWVHSRWTEVADFERHVGLPHTVLFVERIGPLIDHELEASRSKILS